MPFIIKKMQKYIQDARHFLFIAGETTHGLQVPALKLSNNVTFYTYKTILNIETHS